MPTIVKGDGSPEAYEPDKLRRSLEQAGTDKALADDVAQRVSASVKDGMTTTGIYREAFKILHSEERIAAARYSMRRAILELGPTGFPFERYIAALMHAKGYETTYDVIVKGRCVEHEVDVVMKKDGHAIGAELKFHNTPGYKTDVKIALYVRARFWDIQWGAEDRGEKSGIDEGWLITNTKFTSHAIEYASCSGIRLLGWDFPDAAGISALIRETGVYPVTVMTTLSSAEKTRLIADGVTLCHSIAERPESLRTLGLSSKKQAAAIAESQMLCNVG